MEYNGIMNIYKQIVTIQSRTSSQTVTGTSNPTYATRIASLVCSVQKKRLSTVDQFGKLTLSNVFRLYTPVNSTNLAIEETDRVIWGTRSFEIDGIGDGGAQGHHLEIDMLEVK